MLLILVGVILSIPASVLAYWGFGFFQQSPWYLFLLIPFFITAFVIYLNVYWLIVLISIFPYRHKDFPGKVNKWNLMHIRITASFITALQGIIVKKKGFKNMPKEPCLILFNHVSDYDPWILYKIMGGRYAFVGKYALRKIPMVRAMSSSIGTLYVDNNNPELNRQMVDHAVEYITQKGTSVAIAPEGTRNVSGQLMTFKHGGFNIATRSECPIVLVGFNNMGDALKKKKLSFVRINVELFDVVKPEEYKGMSAGEVAELCEKRYQKYLEQ